MKLLDVLYLVLALIWLLCVYISITTPHTQFNSNIVYMVTGFISIIPVIYVIIMGFFKLLGGK